MCSPSRPGRNPSATQKPCCPPVSAPPHQPKSHSKLSHEVALRVEKAFGLDMNLLRMQAWHDTTRMRARAGEIDVQRYQPA